MGNSEQHINAALKGIALASKHHTHNGKNAIELYYNDLNSYSERLTFAYRLSFAISLALTILSIIRYLITGTL